MGQGFDGNAVLRLFSASKSGDFRTGFFILGFVSADQWWFEASAVQSPCSAVAEGKCRGPVSAGHFVWRTPKD